MRYPQHMPSQIKFPEFHGHYMGVPGAVSAQGLKLQSTALTYYVDANHGDANDNHDGTDPDHPLLTIGQAVANVSNNGDVIYVYPGIYSESVVTGDINTDPHHVKLIGVGNSMHTPLWGSGAATSPCLELRTIGWEISGFKFTVPTTDAAIILWYDGSDDISNRTIISNCYFDGATTGLHGIRNYGSPDVVIEDCEFANISGASGIAITSFALGTAANLSYNLTIRGCKFYDNASHVNCGMDGSFVLDNYFLDVGGVDDALVLLKTDDTGGGGNNIVAGNYFTGTYSVAGGYDPSATDVWVGNYLITGLTGANPV